MAQHDITALIARIETAGGSADQLLALDNIQQIGDQVIAWNRKAEAAAYELAEQIEAKAAARRRTDSVRAAVAAGQTCFTKTSRGDWIIVGPVEAVVVGRTVTVTKADGSTRQVRVAEVSGPFEKPGFRYSSATFVDVTPRTRTSGRCAECGGYSTTLTTVLDSSGIPGACCPRCARMDQVERSFA